MLIGSHSDLHNLTGELPMTTDVPGHEGIGRVVKGLPLFVLDSWIVFYADLPSWSRYCIGDDGKAGWSKVCIQSPDDMRALLIAVGGCIVRAGSVRHVRYSIRTVPIRVTRGG